MDSPWSTKHLHSPPLHDNKDHSVNITTDDFEDVENVEVTRNLRTRQDLILYTDNNNCIIRDTTPIINTTYQSTNTLIPTNYHTPPPSTKPKQVTPKDDVIHITVRRSPSNRRNNMKNRKKGVLQCLFKKRGNGKNQENIMAVVTPPGQGMLEVNKSPHVLDEKSIAPTEDMSSGTPSCISTSPELSHHQEEHVVEHNKSVSKHGGDSTNHHSSNSSSSTTATTTTPSTPPSPTLDQLLSSPKARNGENDSTSNHSNTSTNTGFTTLIQSMMEYISEASSSSQPVDPCLSPSNEEKKEDDHHPSDIVPCCSPTSSPDQALAPTMSDDDVKVETQQSLPPLPPPKDSSSTTTRQTSSMAHTIPSLALSFSRSKSWTSFHDDVLDSIEEDTAAIMNTRNSSEHSDTDLLLGGSNGDDQNPNINQSSSGSLLRRKKKERWVNFFDENDFENSTWLEVIIPSSPGESVSVVGIAAVMAAAVIIHPLIFVAGIGTAVWAVGVFHGAERSYEFFSDGAFSQMFWDDTSPELKSNLGTEKDVIEAQQQRVKDAKKYAEEIDRSELQQLQKDSEDDLNDSTELKTSSRSCSINTAISPTPSMIHSSFSKSRQHQRYINILESVEEHFPPLQHQIIQNKEFPGLNAVEFFEVFFSDDAPYSLKEFQETRGDVDIEFGKWKKIQNQDPLSFHIHTEEDLRSFPPSSKKERVLRFKTLTKSSFGPAYATAKKTMRVTKLSRRFIIIESKTELFDIPYCDRFFVLDRWVVEAEKHRPKTPTSENAPIIYTSKLSVDVEVFMMRSCAWERQIQSKSLQTITDFVQSWTKKATQALELTVKKKLERIRTSHKDDKSVISWKSPSVSTAGVGNSEQAIMRLHQKKLKELEKKIAEGDLEWCSIETHLLKKNTRVRSEVLNPNGRLMSEDYDNSINHSPRPQEISFSNRGMNKQRSKKNQKKGIIRVMRNKKA